MEIKMNEWTNLIDLDYADDKAVLEETDVEMTKTTEAIRAIVGNFDLKMSFKKTEIMSIGRDNSSNPVVPLKHECLIKVVSHFRYIRAFCSADKTTVKELNNRFRKAPAAFRELDKVWRDW